MSHRPRKRPSWRQNLQGSGGFWQNANWYDLHIDRRMPLVMPMLEEILVALPPLEDGTSVCDLACGTGNASFALVSTYPSISITLLDKSDEMLNLAAAKVAEITDRYRALRADIEPDGGHIPGGPYDVVIASLAIHSIVGTEVDALEAESRYELVYQGIAESLEPGGHLLIGDHVGSLGLYRQLKAMERAGFVDVDCAWRQDDFFVAGGRLPD